MADLQEFGEGIWITDGPEVRDMGIIFTTRMTIVKLSNGAVWLESPIPVAYDTLKKITGLGPVHYLVAATPRHVWRLDHWHTLFPNAQLWASHKTVFTLQKGQLPFTGFLGDVPPEIWANDFDQLLIKGNPLLSEVLFLHKKSGTVILGDIIQNNPISTNPLRNALFKMEGVLTPDGGVPLDIRLTITNRRMARQSLEKLLSWDFDKVIIAHGPCIEKNARAVIEHDFKWLMR